jgi:hypothetical protein
MAWIFDQPGGVKDFSDPMQWHDRMAAEARGIVRELVGSVLNKDPANVTAADIAAEGPGLGYVDPVAELLEGEGVTIPIAPWPAFPRAVSRRAPWAEFPPEEEDRDGEFRAAEHLGDEDHRPGVFVDGDDNLMHLPVRHRQDEYLEWVGRRNGDGKLSKVIFVAEGYDYFDALFEHDEKRVVELYQEFTATGNIGADDLRAPKGVYRRLSNGARVEVVKPGGFNHRNRFNINPGIVHLSHRANSLGAEVNLAGVSGILRRKADGSVLEGDDAEELLCCCRGGNPNRNSDPGISQQAYAQVKQGKRYTLANPVGLYIASVDHNKVETSAGDPLTDDWWTVVRGDGLPDAASSRVLRLELAPPKRSKLTLEDLVASGVPVRYPGQLAALLSVHLFVTLWDRPAGVANPAVDCVATCCKKTGSSQLVITDSRCGPGFDLAFPNLIPDGPQIAGAPVRMPAPRSSTPGAGAKDTFALNVR